MADLNLLDNRPLARAAIWFLVDAGIVLAIACGFLLNPDLIPELFDHKPLLGIGLVLITFLFSLFAVTSSVLGFLANCKPGRTVGSIALIFLIIGWTMIGTLYWKS